MLRQLTRGQKGESIREMVTASGACSSVNVSFNSGSLLLEKEILLGRLAAARTVVRAGDELGILVFSVNMIDVSSGCGDSDRIANNDCNARQGVGVCLALAENLSIPEGLITTTGCSVEMYSEGVSHSSTHRFGDLLLSCRH